MLFWKLLLDCTDDCFNGREIEIPSDGKIGNDSEQFNAHVGINSMNEREVSSTAQQGCYYIFLLLNLTTDKTFVLVLVDVGRRLL